MAFILSLQIQLFFSNTIDVEANQKAVLLSIQNAVSISIPLRRQIPQYLRILHDSQIQTIPRTTASKFVLC